MHSRSTLVALLAIVIVSLPISVEARAAFPTSNNPDQQRLHPVRKSSRLIRAEALQRRRSEVKSRRFTTMASLANTYENDIYRLSIYYPRDWQAEELMNKNENITTVAFFLSPLEGKNDVSKENINLVTEIVPDMPFSFDDYTNASIKNEQSMFEEYKLRSSHPTLLASLPAHTVTFTALFEGKTLMFEQVWVAKEHVVYIWTLVTPLHTHDRYSRIFHEMLSTLTFE